MAPLLGLLVDFIAGRCYTTIMNIKKRYNFYMRDDGMFLVMDDVEDMMLGVCGSIRIAEDITMALNIVDLEDNEFTKLH